MSAADSIRTPKHLDLKKDHGLKVVWNDERESFYSIGYLRRMSPSADQRQLREEMAKNPLTVLPITSVGSGKPLTATDIKMVGNYAILITFSDGHDTGIFSWEYLDQIDPDKPGPASESDAG
jgi:DUF971 family protein